MQHYKIVIVGEENSGKTSFVTRLMTKDIQPTHVPTIKVDINHIKCDNIILDIHDLAGRFTVEGQNLGYYHEADVCLVFVSLSISEARTSRRYLVEHYVSGIRSICGDIPIILIGCKVDRACQGEFVRLCDDTRHLNISCSYSVSNVNMYGVTRVLNTVVNFVSRNEV